MGGRRLQCLCGWHLSLLWLCPSYIPDSVRFWVQVTAPSSLQCRGQPHICQLSQLSQLFPQDYIHNPVLESLCLQHLEAVLFACSVGMYFALTSLTQVRRLLSNSSSLSNTGSSFPDLVCSSMVPLLTTLVLLFTTLPGHSAPSLLSPGISEDFESALKEKKNQV